MENFLSTIIDFIDKYYHQKNLNKVLLNLDLKTVFDIGAHKGEFSSNMLKNFKYLKIYAFEPQSEIYLELKEKFHQSKNFISYNTALSNINKKKKLNINIKTSTSSFSKYNKDSNWRKLKEFLLTGSKKSSFIKSEIVNVISLDSFCKKKNINRIDLLKIDTEGHEAEVLKGATRMLKKNIKYVLIEFHFSKIYKNYNPKKIENILEKNNFRLVKRFKFPFLAFEDRLYEKLVNRN